MERHSDRAVSRIEFNPRDEQSQHLRLLARAQGIPDVVEVHERGGNVRLVQHVTLMLFEPVMQLSEAGLGLSDALIQLREPGQRSLAIAAQLAQLGMVPAELPFQTAAFREEFAQLRFELLLSLA